MSTIKENFSLCDFFRWESSAGIILFLSLIIALVVANSPLASHYQSILNFPIDLSIGSLALNKSLLLWVNDGLMTIFFMILALEVKREMIVGHLSKMSQVILPCVAALGGIIVPAIIFIAFNHQNSQALIGWAIPTATDVALALGVVVLLGKRVPTSLKIFLVVLAIFDDIIAIAFIALFYTHHLALWSLVIASIGIGILILLNYLKVMRVSIYMLIGFIVWLAVLKSGVHATLAGVAIGLCIPFGEKENERQRPLQYLEKILQPWVAYFILPLFILANAGVPFDQMQWQQLLQPVPLGICLGLFIGKQLGIFTFSWLIIKSGLAHLPNEATWLQLYGIAVLAGIGFTMSLFIGSLAYGATIYEVTSRAGVLLGSLLSVMVGVIVLLNTRLINKSA